MKLNTGKIVSIIFISSLIGLIVNFINPKGISLIREKKELTWAEDTLFSITKTDSSESAIKKSKEQISDNETGSATEGHKDEIENPGEEQTINQKEEEELKDEKTVLESLKEPKAITLDQAYALYKEGVTFIDAREVSDYKAGHIQKSINIPFDDFDNHQNKLKNISKDKPVVTYCGGTDCELSILLGNQLFEMGYKQVYIFFGGWWDWLEAKFPTETSDNSETIQQ